MEQTDRLNQVLAFIRERGWNYHYSEEDGCGSIDFDYRGVPYHIWEFEDGERGVETNVRHGGRQEELLGDYEAELISIMKDWN
jgi:hypothetical protein